MIGLFVMLDALKRRLIAVTAHWVAYTRRKYRRIHPRSTATAHNTRRSHVQMTKDGVLVVTHDSYFLADGRLPKKSGISLIPIRAIR
jgi:hypothetical protein